MNETDWRVILHNMLRKRADLRGYEFDAISQALEHGRTKAKPETSERLVAFTRKPVAAVMLFNPSEFHLFDDGDEARKFLAAYDDARVPWIFGLSKSNVIWHSTA